MRHTTLLLLSCILFLQTFSQEKDFQIWLDLEATTDIGKGFEISLNNEKRFYENVSLFGRNKSDLTLGYNINSEISISASYRKNYYYLFTDITSSKSRWVATTNYSPRYKRWRFDFRARVSNDSETFVPGWFEQRVIHRERLRARYNFRKSPFRVQVSAETYFPISHTPFELMKLRLAAGVQIKTSDNHRFEIGYLREQEYNTTNPMKAYVIQLGYRYSFIN